jgi:short subunit dehydrogenase-like uncharacterized protein
LSVLLVYGASGYTGRLIVNQAVQRGLRPVLAGRDRRALNAMAARLGGLEVRSVALTDARALRAALRGAGVVLNAAGPMSVTLDPLADACLETGAHYLDITGELAVIENASRRDEAARRRSLMLMPAVGFDVVPSDCLAAHVVRRCPGATRLRIGIAGLDLLSRGSAKTIVDGIGKGTVIRRAGRLETLDGRKARAFGEFDFGDGPRRCAAVSWGDVASAFFTTGVPDIAVYFEATPAVSAWRALESVCAPLLARGPLRELFERAAAFLPDGPSDARRATRSATLVAEASAGDGATARSRLRTPEVYGFTAVTAVAVAERVLAGDFQAGFQTPARVYGADFALTLPGVTREDL